MCNRDVFVNFVFLANCTDTDISRATECSWPDFVAVFSEHRISDNKDGPMFAPWIFVDPKFRDEHGRGPRVAENVAGCTMVCLEFDDDSGWTIDDAKVVFRRYTYLGYTSFKHQANGKDRFRIVLPLADVVSPKALVSRRKAICTKFEGVDSTSLSRSRAFYGPTCPEDRKHRASIWRNDGELFDVMAFEEEVVRPLAREYKPITNIKRCWIIDSLKQIFLGQEPAWRNIGLALCHEGFTYDDFCYVSIGGLMRKKTQRDCALKWKSIERDVARGVEVGMGHLINVLKAHGYDYNNYLLERRKEIEAEKARLMKEIEDGNDH